MKEKQKVYYEKNKDTIKQQTREWTKNNSEKVQVYQTRYKDKHRKQRKPTQTKGEVKEYKRLYYQKNKIRIDKQQKEYRESKKPIKITKKELQELLLNLEAWASFDIEDCHACEHMLDTCRDTPCMGATTYGWRLVKKLAIKGIEIIKGEKIMDNIENNNVEDLNKNLATIREIKDIQPIENSDNLEHINVLGWWCVGKKGKFKIGDLCCYIQIDSIVPKIDQFDYMRHDKYRVKTRRFRGAISQGLVIPIEELKEITDNFIIKLDMDVTNLVGVEKWSKPLFFGGTKNCNPKGNFPPFLIKTDEDRVQNFPRILDEWQGKKCISTYKMDGTSVTFYKKGEQFGVCSRNLDLKEDNNLYWNIAKEYGIFKALKAMTANTVNDFAIQGEIVTPKINNKSNPLNIPPNKAKFFAFSLFNITTQQYEDVETTQNMFDYYEVAQVPIHEEEFTFNFADLSELLDYASVDYPNTTNKAEGVVIRKYDETYCNILKGRASFKVINNNYLLKEKKEKK